MASKDIIELGSKKYNGKWLRSVSEQVAVTSLQHKCDASQIRNAWKQANGKTVRNYSEGSKPEAPKPKRKRNKAKADK